MWYQHFDCAPKTCREVVSDQLRREPHIEPITPQPVSLLPLSVIGLSVVSRDIQPPSTKTLSCTMNVIETLGVEIRPIPAFYCCYLLRSRNRKSYYIGSTPNPARRLGQHNGSTKGGAKRTSSQEKRPWEMTCIVTGFPSKFAALQFEWAWQNAHMTRHIERPVRDARAQELSKGKRATSPKKKRKPPMSLEARLKNLHHLLGVESFNRWPLHLRFFATDVFTQWEKHSFKMPTALRKSITIHLTPADVSNPSSRVEGEEQVYLIPKVIQSIPVEHEDSKNHVAKTKCMIEDGRRRGCAVCKKEADASKSLTLICPIESCHMVSHMPCLSTRFLAEEGSRDTLIPIEGKCPTCRSPIRWSAMLKELTLRMRGQKELKALFRTKRRKEDKNIIESNATDAENLSDQGDDLDETWMEEVNDEDDDEPIPNVR